ncbi:MAG: hypothetical protein EXR63_03465 [Dehalococcoidia bacterium]|nr:hypothetical protein [Dehalococcoidia bacterium]
MSRAQRALVPVVSLAIAALVLTGVALLRARDDGASPPGGPTLVLAEFGNTVDRIVTAPAEQPDSRTLVASVEHVAGWGINPSPQAAGTLVAFTVLPPGAMPQRDSPAELRLLDVATGALRTLARDADLLVPPLFDQAGAALVYRASSEGGQQALVRVELASGTQRVLHRAESAFGDFPVGFAADGALVFASLSAGGTDLYRVRAGEPAQLLLHASDQIARDWRLSPNGRAVSYLAPELLAERIVHRAQVLALGADGVARPTTPPGGGEPNEHFAPVWTPDSGALTLGREAYPQRRATAITVAVDGSASRALAAPASGFDVPLGWSPDGHWLAARSFDGVSANQPGTESMVVISDSGRRFAVDGVAELIFLGWVTRD